VSGSLLGMRAFLKEPGGCPGLGTLTEVMKRPQDTSEMDAFQSRGRPNGRPLRSCTCLPLQPSSWATRTFFLIPKGQTRPPAPAEPFKCAVFYAWELHPQILHPHNHFSTFGSHLRNYLLREPLKREPPFILKHLFGAPGWLSWLSDCLWLRS